MRGRSNAGAKAPRSQERSPRPHGPGQCQVRKEIRLVCHGVQGTSETLRDIYMAPWTAGECVSLAMRILAMLKEAGEPDSPSSKKKKKKPFALPFSLGLRGQIKTRAPAKPGRPTPSQSGSQLPLRLAFPCLATKGRTKNKTAQSRL